MSDLFGVVSRVRGMLGPGKPDVRMANDHFSADRRCRFSLEYWWGDQTSPLIVVGQNPSRASRASTDPTVTRCARRAHGAGHGGLLMLNMFPFVATDPEDLFAAGPMPDEERLCLEIIVMSVQCFHGAPVLFAPGGHRHPRHRARTALVEGTLRQLGANLMCLGTTADGQPRHPSRAGYDIPMVPFERPAVAA